MTLPVPPYVFSDEFDDMSGTLNIPNSSESSESSQLSEAPELIASSQLSSSSDGSQSPELAPWLRSHWFRRRLPISGRSESDDSLDSIDNVDSVASSDSELPELVDINELPRPFLPIYAYASLESSEDLESSGLSDEDVQSLDTLDIANPQSPQEFWRVHLTPWIRGTLVNRLKKIHFEVDLIVTRAQSLLDLDDADEEIEEHYAQLRGCAGSTHHDFVSVESAATQDFETDYLDKMNELDVMDETPTTGICSETNDEADPEHAAQDLGFLSWEETVRWMPHLMRHGWLRGLRLPCPHIDPSEWLFIKLRVTCDQRLRNTDAILILIFPRTRQPRWSLHDEALKAMKRLLGNNLK